MTPTDPRHGTYAGYMAHSRAGQKACDSCALARRRTSKRLQLEVRNGARTTYTADEVLGLLEPWLALGLAPTAIANAAGLTGHNGTSLVSGEYGWFRRSTYRAIASLTESDFDAGSLVWADLTRTRIWSLMADGHYLRDMPVPYQGVWRYRPRVSVGFARTVRDYYREHQYRPGLAVHTRSRTRNAGVRPPAAWDDPDTLAWPLGWSSPTDVTAEPAAIDDVTVQRVLSGDFRVPTTSQERSEIAARWHASGRSLSVLGRLTGWKPERYYRIRDTRPAEEVA